MRLNLAATGPCPFRVLTSSVGHMAKNAGGIFSSEWVPWTDIFAVCHNCDPLTSIRLRALFRGKSVNTAGFLMAALKDAGLIERKEGRIRHYALTQKALKGGKPG